MYLRSVYYGIKVLLRSRAYLFWCLCFPMVLGTLFHVAFGNLAAGEEFAPVKTAVVLKEGDEGETFREFLQEFGEPGENQLLEITYATEEEAMALLEKKEVTGILYGGEEVTLTISGEMDYDKLNQSILQTFVEHFRSNYHALMDVAKKHPENLAAVVEALSHEIRYNNQISFAKGNMDESLSYFFNLIAMTCMFGCTAGANVAIHSQANLSTLAMRKGVSPVRKLVNLLGEITATFLVQFAIACISVFYLWLVLKVDLGNHLGYVILIVFAGCLEGVSFGFLIGCIGKMSESAKTGLLMAVTMVLCFLSGLMVQGMRLLVERTMPFLNKINPSALISDSFYSLAVYESHSRYMQNIGTLFLLSAVFFLVGVALVRRERYASL